MRGGLFAMAMPRGSGKSTISECACIWAVLFGHREFVCLIGSDEGHAMDMLDAIKMEFDGNDLLLEDFPDVVYPIQCLDGIANRCNGQLFKGERTHIGWTAREVVLPTIPGSTASRTRERTLGNNLSWLRWFAVTLLERHPTLDSLRGKMLACGYSTVFLEEVLEIKGN